MSLGVDRSNESWSQGEGPCHTGAAQWPPRTSTAVSANRFWLCVNICSPAPQPGAQDPRGPRPAMMIVNQHGPGDGPPAAVTTECRAKPPPPTSPRQHLESCQCQRQPPLGPAYAHSGLMCYNKETEDPRRGSGGLHLQVDGAWGCKARGKQAVPLGKAGQGGGTRNGRLSPASPLQESEAQRVQVPQLPRLSNGCTTHRAACLAQATALPTPRPSPRPRS